MISKELLSEVLGVELESHPFTQNKTELGYMDMNDYWHTINIHELAHKCKEWACGETYKDVGSWRRYDSDNNSYYWLVVIQTALPTLYHQTFTADTEPEAIFKACEWILEQKDNK